MTVQAMSERPMWEPSQALIENANVTAFARQAIRRWKLEFNTYPEFYAWSVDRPEQFWDSVWDYCGVVASNKGARVLVDGERMPGAKWFPEARLNFAENLLRRHDAADALVFWDETGFRRRVSHAELHAEVSRAAQAMRAEGLVAGDRVAAFIPNMPETAVLALAAISIGAVWSCCSPDFGTDGVLDRFGQTGPKLLFCADGYLYNGKAHGSLARVQEMAAQLPSVRRVVVVPHLALHSFQSAMHSFQSAMHSFQSSARPEVSGIANALRYADWIAPYAPGRIAYEQLPFDHPLYILFTSGTTGKPKCIVHGAGGTLLAGLKTYKLQFDVRPLDRFFYYTTCNWVMWNLLFQGLLAEASIMLYDGSPFMRDAAILFDFCDAERFTQFGTSAKFIDAIAKRGMKPRKTHSLASVRTIISTGSPLVPESYDYVYREIKRDVCLSSISGGTDIMGCFADANPILPVWRGELQCRSLGMKVEVWDEDGRALVGRKGELVCTRPFPSMPVGFWNDPGGKRYHEAYFARYPNVWCHGDYCELTARGTMIVYGRSDATLNPGGVRIGTAEIYGQVEKIDAVEESVAIGQLWPPEQPSDTRVVLFVKLRPGLVLDALLEERIRRQIREHTTARHVPARIVQVPDIPRTKNGKVVELAVKAMVHGMPVTHTDALANPEVLALFRNIPELAV
jgi:acetoacetyl-CoA synthetase